MQKSRLCIDLLLRSIAALSLTSRAIVKDVQAYNFFFEPSKLKVVQFQCVVNFLRIVKVMFTIQIYRNTFLRPPLPV